MSEPPLRHRFAINHGDHAIDGDFRRNPRPIERAHQRLRQRQARRLDHDVIGRRLAIQQLFHRRNKVIGHGAADAAVRQLHHVILGAGLIPAAFQYVTIHAQIAEFVNNQSNALALSVLQHVPDQCRFARA